MLNNSFVLMGLGCGIMYMYVYDYVKIKFVKKLFKILKFYVCKIELW